MSVRNVSSESPESRPHLDQGADHLDQGADRVGWIDAALELSFVSEDASGALKFWPERPSSGSPYPSLEASHEGQRWAVELLSFYQAVGAKGSPAVLSRILHHAHKADSDGARLRLSGFISVLERLLVDSAAHLGIDAYCSSLEALQRQQRSVALGETETDRVDSRGH